MFRSKNTPRLYKHVPADEYHGGFQPPVWRAVVWWTSSRTHSLGLNGAFFCDIAQGCGAEGQGESVQSSPHVTVLLFWIHTDASPEGRCVLKSSPTLCITHVAHISPFGSVVVLTFTYLWCFRASLYTLFSPYTL